MRSAKPNPILVGDSAAMAVVRRFVARAGAVDAPVLLLGETGTGKSLLARAIHAAGVRSRGPYVAVNCAAVPEALFESELFGHRRGAFTGASEDRAGLLESAHGGTLLLDEVGDLPLPQQAKLLTVLEEGEVRPVGARATVRVDVRLVSATACELGTIAAGAFRRDLYHRLALLELRLPPLRERAGDVPLLAAHLLAAAAARHRLACPRLDEAATRLLMGHGWPGNVRELGHALEAALILGLQDDFAGSLATVLAGRPEANEPPAAADHARYSFYGSDDAERERIRDALDRRRGNRTRAALDLGMSRNTLRDRMRRFGL